MGDAGAQSLLDAMRARPSALKLDIKNSERPRARTCACQAPELRDMGVSHVKFLVRGWAPLPHFPVLSW